MPYKPTIPRVCQRCSGDFLAYPSQIKIGTGNYCSKSCALAARNVRNSKQVTLTCETCGRSFLRKRSDIARRPADSHVYCGYKCRSAAPPAPAILSDDGLSARIPLQARDGSVTGYTVIDASDLEWAGKWRWHANKISGRIVRNGERDGRQQAIYLHREVLRLPPDDRREGDHIDRDVLNNRRGNLRIATRGQNAQNLSPRSGTSSRYRGVSLNKATGRWVAYAHVDRKRIHLGFFDSEDAAGIAAAEARSRHMPFATD